MKKRSLFLLLLGVMLIAASPFAGTNAYADGDAPQTVQEGADSAEVQVEVPEIVQGAAGADPAEMIEQPQEVRSGADSSDVQVEVPEIVSGGSGIEPVELLPDVPEAQQAGGDGQKEAPLVPEKKADEAPAPKNLEVTLANATAAKVSVVMCYRDLSGEEVARGWWNVDAKSERKITFKDAQGPLYFYAQGGGYRWEGDEEGLEKTIANQAFKYTGDQVPQFEKPRSVRLAEGPEIGADGKVTIDLSDETAAWKPQIKRRVSLVNRTPAKIYVALLYVNHSNGQPTARGWWNVEPNATREIDLNADAEPLYFYAQGGDYRWQGSEDDPAPTVVSNAFNYAIAGKDPEGKNPRSVHFVAGPVVSENGTVVEFSDANSSRRPAEKRKFTIANQSPVKVFYSLIYTDTKEKQLVRGWWNVEPGASRTIETDFDEGKPVYYYAQGGGWEWSGGEDGTPASVFGEAFRYEYGGERPKLKNPRQVSFVEGPELSASETIIELTADSATKRPAEKRKVTFTNETNAKIYVSLLYTPGDQEQDTVRGWWGIEPGASREVTLTARDEPISYYAYGGGYEWQGGSDDPEQTVFGTAFQYNVGSSPKGEKPRQVRFVEGPTLSVRGTTVRLTAQNASSLPAVKRTITIVNPGKAKAYVALIFKPQKDRPWTAIGWYNVEPGGSKDAKIDAEAGTQLYYYAQGGAETRGQGISWNVVNTGFRYEKGQVPQGDNLRAVTFVKGPLVAAGETRLRLTPKKDPKIRLINDTGEKVWAAFVYNDRSSGSWRAKAWWGVEPGSTCEVNLPVRPNTNVYIYAYNKSREWQGGSAPIKWSIVDGKFDYGKGGFPVGNNLRSVAFYQGPRFGEDGISQRFTSQTGRKRVTPGYEVELVNNSAKDVYAAFIYYDNVHGWYKRGWYKAPAHGQKIVKLNARANNPLYYYAMSGNRAWEGGNGAWKADIDTRNSFDGTVGTPYFGTSKTVQFRRFGQGNWNGQKLKITFNEAPPAGGGLTGGGGRGGRQELIDITNFTRRNASVCLVYYHEGDRSWVAQGWWNAPAGKRTSIRLPARRDKKLYWYAKAGMKEWYGTSLKWPITDSKFLYSELRKPASTGKFYDAGFNTGQFDRDHWVVNIRE